MQNTWYRKKYRIQNTARQYYPQPPYRQEVYYSEARSNLIPKKYEVLRKKLNLKEALPSDTIVMSDNHWAEPRNEVKLNDSLFNNREKR